MPWVLLILGPFVAVIGSADEHVSHADVGLGGYAPGPGVCEIHISSLIVP